MDRELAELHRALVDLGPKRPGRRIPARLKSRILSVVRGRQANGESQRGLAEALGLSGETLRRWLTAPSAVEDRAPVRPLPVSVMPLPSPAVSLALVTPTGYRVEGLTVASAVELLSRLR